ncbi:MAG: hypothetical protein J6T73_03565 [Clostridia bacterium]|nr:hypothetical protein [Clostridia bacterium]
MEKEINSAGNAISEAVSENKRHRGRPTVFERDHMEDFDRLITGAFREKTRRTIVAHYYRSSVFGILEEHNDIPYLEEIFKVDNAKSTCKQKDEILEQLGRMYAQDGYDEDTIIYAATLAARFYHNGNTVKEIAAYLRRVRKTKSWDV